MPVPSSRAAWPRLIRAVVCLWLTGCSLPALAQTGAASAAAIDLSRRLAAGDRITILETNGAVLDGYVIDVRPADVSIALAGGQRRTVAVPGIARLVRKDSIRNGVLIGLIAGAGAGLTGGLVINAICVNETGGCPGIVALLSALGAAGGAGLGAAADGMRSEVVYVSSPQPAALPLSRQARQIGQFQPEVLASAGGGSVSRAGRSLPAGPTVAGAWSFRKETGLGVQIEVLRTTSSSRRTVDCVRADSPFVPPNLAGQCLGNGEEGVNKVLIGAARVLYFFPMKSRVQPYAGGGAGIHNTRAFSPIVVFPPGGQPMVASAIRTGTRAGVSASAGTRLALTHALAIDPSVMLFKSEDQTLTRISVGFAYQW